MSVFVTGTDTGCGKTLVSCALLECLKRRGITAIGMKPVASGAERSGDRLVNDDVEALVRASGVAAPPASVNPYCFEPPCSPNLAAAMAGVAIDPGRIRAAYEDCAGRAEVVVVEGVGGWCVPLGGGVWIEDLACRLGLPVVLVVGVRLGCINHAVLSARAIAAAPLPFAGWIANVVEPDMVQPGNVIQTMAETLPAPLLGVTQWSASGDAADLADELESAARAVFEPAPAAGASR